jgi:5-hydroxyisourate hydrolase-like protein (transthyretin family)/protocatechuate 3,4-dioxygenase beta subunit
VNSEDRRQKTEDRRQKLEVRSQKSEVRSQKSEVRSQKSEVRSQKLEVKILSSVFCLLNSLFTMRRFIICIVFAIVLIGLGTRSERAIARVSFPGEVEEYSANKPVEQATVLNSDFQQERPLRSYLFIHDDSLNMRRRKRISIMQTSIRTVLENIPSTAYAGLRAFGHRFPVEGPDVCNDTEIVVPMDRLVVNREDFETQLNILAYPPIGGGSPVGLALKQGISDIHRFQGPKEVYLYLVDLLKCEDTNPLDIIGSACEINDLHLTLVGFGLKSDLQTLLQSNIQRLGCVDIVNVTTPEEADTLAEQLLTRFSVEFRNAEGHLVDPVPGDKLILQLFQKDSEGNLNRVRQKVKDSNVKGTSIDTVGLNEGTYFLDLSYRGQKLRTQREISVKAKQEVYEVIKLGKMYIDVTDSDGKPIDDPAARQLKITVTESGQEIRTATNIANAEFDLLPGNKYKVFVSYVVKGEIQETEFREAITIEEGNHKNISIPLPIGSISGKVIDLEGRPAQNVEMKLTGTDAATKSKKMQRSVTTDENGNYIIPDLSAGAYELSFHKPGYKSETQRISVVGGKINTIEDIQLFHGIEVFVLGVSGTMIEEADVKIINKSSLMQIPVTRVHDTYRNTTPILEGEYTVSVQTTGYKAASQEISIRDADPSVEMSFHLSYYITVNGTVFNGKGEPLPDAVIEFQNRHSVLEVPLDGVYPERSRGTQGRPEAQQQVTMTPDGSFYATLLVTGVGDEAAKVLWKDLYNQDYVKEVTFSLPLVPQSVNLGKIVLPINFLRLTVTDILGEGLTVDTVGISHLQTGQTGIQMTLLNNGLYESTALLDGDYTVRIIKEGYQEVEQNIPLSGGEVVEIPVTLYNYVTVSSTVVNGKDERVSGAFVKFQGLNSELTALQPVMTGKDGRFQTTLLVKKAQQEKIEVVWTSPHSQKSYRIETEFELPGVPISESHPMDLGTYQLPVNFINLEVQNTSKKGLPGAQVLFISEQGEITSGVELGGGMYESIDLQDGRYDISITKEGYKENFFIAGINVGKNQREVPAGPVVLPHYATVTGKFLNGKDEGIPNVEIFFGEKQSEQLERCRTDQDGRFTTTLLVTGSGEESWQAIWRRKEYSASGSFPLPIHTGDSVNIGEIYLPVNFVSLPVEDVQGNSLSGVTVEVRYKEGTPIELEEFTLEEVKQGTYQAKNLPDGVYTFSLHKENYEIGKTLDIKVEGGKHYVLEPLKLGYYVTVRGIALNGKQEPVADAVITFSQLYSTFFRPKPREGQEAVEESLPLGTLPPSSSVVTKADGTFTAQLLVNAPGIEQLVVSREDRELGFYPLNLSGVPGTRDLTLHLPINFIRLHLTDVSGKPLSGALVTVTHQTEKIMFPTEEVEAGIYETPGIPNGHYVVFAGKEHYKSRAEAIKVQGGEVQHLSYYLNHYVTVKGRVTNGKNEGIAAATIHFGNLKTEVTEKIISGTDGVFEAELLITEVGRETGEITWVGKHGTYTKQFWVDLPAQPAVLTLAQEDSRLPLNFISLELKSIAATGVPGATVKLTHRETGQIIEARDLDNGNYEGEELPDGPYDISITKNEYKAVVIENIVVANGEHKSDIQVPKFLHYITVDGIVLNGKNKGVSGATVAVKSSKRLQECEPVATREDGSFTLHALVTDIGVETVEVVWQTVVWNTTYTIALPVTLPSIPQHIQLGEIKLPINFIALTVQNIFGKNISGVTVSFLKKEQGTRTEENLSLESRFSSFEYSSAVFPGIEIADGMYESPELPDGEYSIIVRKDGYIQKHYPTVSVKSGIMASDVIMNLPHLVTVKGVVTDGKGNGVAGVKVHFSGHTTQMSTYQLYTDNSGYFSEQLQVTGPGKETVTVTTPGSSYNPAEQFEFTQEFEPLTKPGEQELANLHLPINFIPVRVQDVSGHEIEDATVTLTRVSTNEGQSEIRNPKSEIRNTFSTHNLGQGKYEGYELKDGTYTVSVSKEGYETQERRLTVMSGEVAPETMFILPHYVVIKGMVTDGRGNGVPEAILEFDTQNITVLETRNSKLETRNSEFEIPQIKTDAEGHFIAYMLVKKAGLQRLRAVWHKLYVKQFSFQLPEQPDMNYILAEEIRLPINFAPVRVTNVLGEGLSGATITLNKTGSGGESSILFHSLGEGLYEARELLDGVYRMMIHKDGYQDATGNISVQGGEQAPEQSFLLPHFVTVQGTVVNGKGIGVAGANVILTGLNSQLVDPNQKIVTEADGSFQIDLLVTGAGHDELREHIEITWVDTLATSTSEEGERQTIPFGISHDFYLSSIPGNKNLGLLTLPANFAAVSVQDISGKGLSGVQVTFVDENGRTFNAKEFAGGFYEGQNLPDGTYMVKVFKEGYKEGYKTEVQLGATSESLDGRDEKQPISLVSLTSEGSRSTYEPLAFQLPYYVTLEGTTVDGKGQKITSDITIGLVGSHSQLLPETVVFDRNGNFKANLIVNASGREQLHITYAGEHGLHSRQVPFVLPEVPKTVNLERIVLPVNFIPIEVKDLRGYGLKKAEVTLSHIENGKEFPAEELGDGRYEGKNLLDGSYRISVAKEGYKSVENPVVTVAGGIVSEVKSFRLQHYVWITGTATNGEGEGLRDPVIQMERLCSLDTQKQSDVTGKFEVKLEVQKVGNEKMSVTWKNNMYRTPVVFKLPGQPERKNLGEIRLPVNFFSILVTDISGSTLRDASVTVEDASGNIQALKTDQNGFCKTSDLQNGKYKVSVEKSGYKLKSQEVYVSDGKVASVRFMLPHYVVVRGEVKDILQNPIGGADVIFEEFTDAEGQKLRTTTQAANGGFEQKLLIDDPKFLERQKGHFLIKKGNIEQVFTFKVPTEPNYVLHYKTLLFPTRYLLGKVVDAEVNTIPIPNANVSLVLIAESTDIQQAGPSGLPGGEVSASRESFGLTANSLGVFEVGNLREGEYKIIIQKEGYSTREDFVRISGLLQEQEFTLRKE